MALMSLQLRAVALWKWFKEKRFRKDALSSLYGFNNILRPQILQESFRAFPSFQRHQISSLTSFVAQCLLVGGGGWNNFFPEKFRIQWWCWYCLKTHKHSRWANYRMLIEGPGIAALDIFIRVTENFGEGDFGCCRIPRKRHSTNRK